MTAATAVVRFAAWMLPKGMRDRYREQWLADLRDAEEAGIHPAEIAIGSLSFAATLARPLSAGRRLSAETVSRRSRLAIALSLSTALWSVSLFASTIGGGIGIRGNSPHFIAVLELSRLLVTYAVLASIVAVLLVAVTRHIASHVRLAVGLYVVASLAPAAQVAADNFLGRSDYLFYRGSAWVYLVAAILVAGASLILWRNSVRARAKGGTRSRHVVAAGVGALAVLASMAGEFLNASLSWADRTPIEFGPYADPAWYPQWLSLKEWGDRLVLSVFVIWAIVAGLAALAILGLGLLRWSTSRIIALTSALLFTGLIVHGAVIEFLWLMLPVGVEPAFNDVVLLLGRWGLIVVVLISVGNLDFWRWRLTGVRRRPDVDAELIED